jgi:hypothetical protein
VGRAALIYFRHVDRDLCTAPATRKRTRLQHALQEGVSLSGNEGSVEDNFWDRDDTARGLSSAAVGL